MSERACAVPYLDAPDSKPSNPKDIIGATKLPMHLVPDITKAYLALGHGEGMLKYGLVNWRAVGVRASIYLAALARHIAKWTEGEESDPTTKVPHLASALACLSILVDAIHAGKLVDDRPLSNPGARAFIDGDGAAIWRGLIKLFEECSPHHYTIGDEEVP